MAPVVCSTSFHMLSDQSIDVYVKSATLPPECRGVLTAQDIVNLTVGYICLHYVFDNLI